MTKVIGIRFRKAGKVYYFSPGENEIKTGDHVIVETAEAWSTDMWCLEPTRWMTRR